MYLHWRDPDRMAAHLAAAAETGTRWLLCVADRHGHDVPALLSACSRQGVEVFGGIFPGLIAAGKGCDSGIVALPLPADSRAALATLGADGLQWAAPPPDQGESRYASSILLVDCLAHGIEVLMDHLFDRFGSRLHHVGAGAGYHDLRAAPVIFTRDGLHRSAALMVAIPRRLSIGVKHGWTRVAGPFVVSRSEGNLIQELNWEPAGEFYRQQVGLQNPLLRDRPVFPDLNSTYPLCIAKEGSEDIVRDPMEITAAGQIKVLSDVAENSVMYLAHGDQETLIEAARRAVEDCGPTRGNAQCFVSDCYSRVLMMGDALERELQAARAALRTNADLEGVQALGEIAANGRQRLEFFNKTFVIGLLHSGE